MYNIFSSSYDVPSINFPKVTNKISNISPFFITEFGTFCLQQTPWGYACCPSYREVGVCAIIVYIIVISFVHIDTFPFHISKTFFGVISGCLFQRKKKPRIRVREQHIVCKEERGPLTYA